VDPDAHQVLFENEHVRVIHARASHGWESAINPRDVQFSNTH
jgi:hypothetical protein